MVISSIKAACLLINFVIFGVSISLQFPNSTPNSCGLDQFRCSNGKCIASEFLCDGRKHCTDGTDETRTECLKPEIICPEYAFRCDYGACVDGDAVCNGINDCMDKSDEKSSKCHDRNQTNTSINQSTCGDNQFRCDNGQCIDDITVCDGSTECTDRSDETSKTCESTQCLPFTFRCAYGGCIDGDKKCNGVRNCADGSDEEYILCDGQVNANTQSTIQRVPITRTSYTTTESSSWPRQPCPPPPQPSNGRWMLHKSQCQGDSHCDAHDNMTLEPGSYLVYQCNEGYKFDGSGDVYCGPGGKWSKQPICTEIRCKSLSSASRIAECTFDDQWISCEMPVPPRTEAKLSCRVSFRQDIAPLGLQRDNVRCNSKGEWEPAPIECVPGPLIINIFTNDTVLNIDIGGINDVDDSCKVSKIIEILRDKVTIYTEIQQANDHPQIDCGVRAQTSLIPLIVNGKQPNITEFPWHATLYRSQSNGDEKIFICGATIISNDLLITAAHCVYDEDIKRVGNAETFAVATGNIFRDYDSPLHDSHIVHKRNIKKIYISCNYLGFDGNYARDIAILHVDKPFVFTSFLVPICLDRTTNDQTAIDVGKMGIVAGFGRTETGPSSGILQSITLPVVPLSHCKSASVSAEAEKFITIDKFCAGYTNGTSVCDGDSGGGLAFSDQGLWYLRGIVSVGIGTKLSGGSRTCDSHLYSLYTKISSHITWIQDIIFKINTGRIIPHCHSTSH
ncbi:hypothetical protein PV326_005920 [Microctonus aethiopoides]|nr:hypothetical protein PV326_005920 [Microctonus aethiopoides]